MQSIFVSLYLFLLSGKFKACKPMAILMPTYARTTVMRKLLCCNKLCCPNGHGILHEYVNESSVLDYVDIISLVLFKRIVLESHYYCE